VLARAGLNGGRRVPADGSARPPGDRDTLIRAAIRNWRDGLINLTGSNRLLNFKPSRTGSVELTRPPAEEVLARLARRQTYQFRALQPRKAEAATGQPENAEAGPGQPPGSPAAELAADQVQPLPPPSPDTLDADTDPDELASALRSLYRRSTQEYLDRGLSVLYLAFGTLAWTDDDGSRNSSPLLLVPVELEHKGPRQPPVLRVSEDDPVVNPALVLKLAQRGIELPRADVLEDLALGTILGAVRAAVAAAGWQVSDTLVLSCFSFAKEAMYRDLLDHEDLIAAHPAVAALATGARAEDAGFSFDEVPDAGIDRRAAPESTPVILDADSSQRACIAAALDGRSFVMDGPPGTGKSQTIANMIGVLLAAGKTVLFVSEKAAALDVVRDRLDAAGLHAYLLELHSHKATRKEVAVALGEALDTVPVAPAPMPAVDVDAVRKQREQLNSYADAMNRLRPLTGTRWSGSTRISTGPSSRPRRAPSSGPVTRSAPAVTSASPPSSTVKRRRSESTCRCGRCWSAPATSLRRSSRAS